MPKGPKGEKRHADTVQNAMLIGRIATGEVEDAPSKAPNRAKGGNIGGKARSDALSSEQRAAIAKKAAQKRWES
ncbi:RNA-binding protein [Bradyrhizobium diazoefficiens]|uniref:RNA-binding protein n=1 Tax=Bradyrhizobium diazoefficiens TaxID=1355477 RepID=UPI001B8B358B|nr:RNA-binding protein [Bradyrhizobium diazoefficiens]MBR0866297.1 RNA-binding protein [Bradyrhizobium diazoefficiens]MBR0890758.1 RNA-binding protein [Bradyrhizobium diazoefficiens]MBR0922591.1 RNA-binding protein [Bradyrhizobium diazoefficiens]